MTQHTTHRTTDHNLIRAWAEKREAAPAQVRDTGDGDLGMLTLDVRGHGAGEESLEHVPWDDWFEKFERESLAFVYQHEKASGEPSTFFRLVGRDEEE